MPALNYSRSHSASSQSESGPLLGIVGWGLGKRVALIPSAGIISELEVVLWRLQPSSHMLCHILSLKAS